MAATDQVPCFYTGQDYRLEPPAQTNLRSEVREFKRMGLGKFIDNGKAFLFAQQRRRILHDGPTGVGNLLPFSKPHCYGAKLHYETAMAGDGNWIDGYTPRRRIYISARSLFNVQILPERVSA